MDAIQYLLHLHSCEQEGITSGMPTPQQWIDAVEAARKQYAEQYSGEPVAWLCRKQGQVQKVTRFLKEVARYEEWGYTITPLYKKP